MTPDLSYTTGREGESSAWIIHGMEKKLIQLENSFSDKLHQQVITAVQWGYFHIVRGGINPGDISVIFPALSKL